MRALPEVSVVVPTYGRAHLLARLVEALEAQEIDMPYEIVVVDDASSDTTWEELRRLEEGRAVPFTVSRHERNRGPAAARNTGWRAAHGRVVAFTDDDCVPQPRWLAALVAATAHADVVVGRTVPDPGARPVTPFSRVLTITRETGNYETCNIAYRRDLLERLGGFDEGYRCPAGEDTDLGWRARKAGAVTAYEAAALVHHDVRSLGFAGYLRDTRRWEAIVRLVREHPELRAHMHTRWVWRPSHAPALLAAAGLAGGGSLAARGAGRAAIALAAGAALPYLRHRVLRAPLPGGRRSFVFLPLVLVADLYEVGVMAAASVRYRTLVL